MGGGVAGAAWQNSLVIRSGRVSEDPGGAGGVENVILSYLAVYPDLLSHPGAVCYASLCCRIFRLEYSDAARLYRRRLFHRAAAAGDCSSARVTIFGMEFLWRTKWVPDGVTPRRGAAVSRATARAGGCVHRMSHLQAAFLDFAPRGSGRIQAMERLRERRRHGCRLVRRLDCRVRHRRLG